MAISQIVDFACDFPECEARENLVVGPNKQDRRFPGEWMDVEGYDDADNAYRMVLCPEHSIWFRGHATKQVEQE